jgi:hypothetical protein
MIVMGYKFFVHRFDILKTGIAGEKKARKTLIHSALLRGTKAAIKRSSYLA